MRARVVMAAVAVAAVLAGQAEAASRYTALGDSFAAGPLIPLPLPPLGCLKSSNNYGRIAQRTLQYAEYRDATCSGAETEDMENAQNVSPGPNPPQFGSLSPDNKLVTITIGGNDIGFSELAENCVSILPFGSPCRNRYVRDGNDEISRRIRETAPKVAAVLMRIRQLTSPDTQILVVNYSAILPHGGFGCYPRMPLARGDVVWLRAKQEELNAMLAEQAGNEAEVVDVYAESAGRDACASSGNRWVEPYIPGTAAAPLHPNLRGMQAMAAMVVAADERS